MCCSVCVSPAPPQDLAPSVEDVPERVKLLTEKITLQLFSFVSQVT